MIGAVTGVSVLSNWILDSTLLCGHDSAGADEGGLISDTGARAGIGGMIVSGVSVSVSVIGTNSRNSDTPDNLALIGGALATEDTPVVPVGSSIASRTSFLEASLVWI